MFGVDGPAFFGVEDGDVGGSAFAQESGVDVDDSGSGDGHHFDGAFEGDDVLVDEFGELDTYLLTTFAAKLFGASRISYKALDVNSFVDFDI